MRSTPALALAAASLVVTVACSDASAKPLTATTSSSPAALPTSATTPASPAARTAAQQHAATPPRFHWSVKRVTKRSLGKSWHDGCPIPPRQLRAISMTFWGFDRTAHHGVLIGRSRAVDTYVAAFRRMYNARFPLRRLQPVSVYDGSDNKSMRHDNTSAFNCRYAVSDGPKHWSMHAYGEAVDINPVENPYELNGRIYPAKGAPYTDRSNVRRGMIVDGSVPVRVFHRLGWGWGGDWSSSPDYQHFSSTGG